MERGITMNLDWIPSFMLYILGILILALSFKNRLIKKRDYKKDNWRILLEKEHAIQFVRSTELPQNLFIQVDSEAFPTVELEACQQVYSTLLRNANKPMVNLKDQSNLDLKSLYGPQIVDKVSVYEKNYFEFMDILFKYGKILYDNNYVQEAQMTLEQGIKYHCDVSKCYLLLIKIYKEQKNKTAISRLKNVVEKEMKNSPLLHKVLEQF